MLPVASNSRPQRQVLARFSVSALVASLPLLYVSLVRPPPAALAGSSAFWFLMSNCVVAAIVAADDAGTLFFGSSKARAAPCFHDDEDPSYYYVPGGGGGQPALAFDEASTVTTSGGDSVVVADHGALPFLVHGDGGEVVVEPSTDDKNDNAVLKGRRAGEDGIARPSSSASDEAVPRADEFGISTGEMALHGPEPPEPCIAEEEEMEEEIPEAWARAQRSRTPDLRQGKGAGQGTKLRRSVTEGSTAEERDYWELSDEELNRRVEEFIARFNREMRRQVEQEAGVV